MSTRSEHEGSVPGEGEFDVAVGPVDCDLGGNFGPGGTQRVRGEVRVRASVAKAPDDALAALHVELEFVLRRGLFDSLDDAALALARYALAPPVESDGALAPPVDEARVRLRAGDALASARLRRDEVGFARESKSFGRVDIVHETSRCGIYRLRIRPGGSIPTHIHSVMDERELVLGDGLLVQRTPAPRGSEFRWPHGFPHRYDNPTAREQSVLCIDCPRFEPDDEREVPDPAGGLKPLL